jgi:TPR repeat protein
MYFNGFGVERDYEQARQWLLKAAERRYDRAQLAMGMMYYYGFGGEQNYDLAGTWFQKAANHGFGGSSTALRRMEEMGVEFIHQCPLWVNTNLQNH